VVTSVPEVRGGGYGADGLLEVLDPCRILRPVSVTLGRSGVTTQPDAPVLRFKWKGTGLPLRVGDPVTVTTGVTESRDSARFAGHVDAIAAREDAGVIAGWDVTVVGGQARAGRVPVRLDRPAESDAARVAAIAVAAGVPVRVVGSPGPMLAADAMDRDMLSALHEVCASSGGLVWQDRSGDLIYGTRDHRENIPPVVQLPSCAVLDGVTWDQSAGDVINHVTAVWGPSDGQQQVTHRDQVSIDRHELRHADITTMCADESGAEQLALLVLARRAWPFWHVPDVIISMDDSAQAQWADVLDLEVGSLIRTPVPPAPGPTPSPPTVAVVEGWVETWDESGHWMQLACSDYYRWVARTFRSWADQAEESWAHWAEGTWLEQLIVIPFPDREETA